MTQWLNLLGWAACVVYSTIPSFWFLIHPRVEYWRSRKRSPFYVLLPAWMAMWIVLGLVTAPWRHFALYKTLWSWVPALALFGVGVWLYTQSIKSFSPQQLGGLPELVAGHREQRLVTTGIRAHVRHPVYLAHVCEMLAWSVITGLAICYALTGFAIFTGAIMIRLEDAELESRFGAQYRVYRQRVPSLLPHICAKWPT